MTVFVDTSVIMYAGGAEHPHRDSCRHVLQLVADRRLDAVTSTEVVQEILHRFARGRRVTGHRMARSVLELFDSIVPIDLHTIGAAVGLYDRYPQLSARDVLHVATCASNDVDRIVSVDSGFGAVTEVRHVHPADLLGETDVLP